MRIISTILKFTGAIILALFLFGMFLGVKIFSTGATIFKSSAGEITPLTLVSELNKTGWKESPATSINGESGGRTNILLLGKGGENHPGGELTDAMMLMSFKFDKDENGNQKIDTALVSIPRDLYVPIANTSYYTRINAIKLYGEEKFGPKKSPKGSDQKDYENKRVQAGIDFLKKTFEDVFGTPIHYYAEMDFEGFANVIDDLGGVDFTLEDDINDPSYPGPNYTYDPFYLKKGTYHLDGKTALKIMRTRHTAQGDYTRIARQQKLIATIKNKIITGNSMRDFFLFTKLLDGLKNHLATDINPADFKRFWEIGSSIDPAKIITRTIDKDPETGLIKGAIIGGAQVLVPRSGNYDDIRDTLYYVFDDAQQNTIAERAKGYNPVRSDEREIMGIDLEKPTLNIIMPHREDFSYDKLISSLQDKGFEVISVEQSQNKNLPIDQTIIFDNTLGKKPVSLKYLEKSFNANTVKPENNLNYEADFTILLNL